MTPYIQSLHHRKSAYNLILDALRALVDDTIYTNNEVGKVIFNRIDELESDIEDVDHEISIEEYYAKSILDVVNVGDVVRFKDEFAVDSWYAQFDTHSRRLAGVQLRYPFDLTKYTFSIDDIRSALIWCKCEGTTITLNAEQFKNWMEVIS